MLERFLYLDTGALDGYLSSVEDGLRTVVESENRTEGGAEGKLDFKIAGGSGNRKNSSGAKTTTSDTPQARYKRLISVLESDPETYDWNEVMDIDNDLDSVAIGSIVKLECELRIPDAVQLLASGELSSTLELIQNMLPMARDLNLDTSGIPGSNQMAEMAKIAKNLPSENLVVVGEPDSDTWKIAGKIRKEYLNDSDLDGLAVVVGKVARKWKSGEWKNLLILPGLNLVPRAQRREMEKQKPTQENADSHLEGPAMMLDILAIYR